MSAAAKPGIALAAGETAAAHGVSFAEAFKVWLRVALLSFAGPAGQIAVMHRIVVEGTPLDLRKRASCTR